MAALLESTGSWAQKRDTRNPILQLWGRGALRSAVLADSLSGPPGASTNDSNGGEIGGGDGAAAHRERQ